MPTSPINRTEVRIRPLAEGDAESVVRWRAAPRVASQLFAGPPTLAAHRRWFEAYSARNDRREYVIEMGGDLEPVGTIGLSAIDTSIGRAEYGILIGEDAAIGRGVGAAATEAILRVAFEELLLRRVYLHVLADNATATGLYARSGFALEGRLREHHLRDGKAIDVLVMGILRIEFMAPTLTTEPK